MCSTKLSCPMPVCFLLSFSSFGFLSPFLHLICRPVQPYHQTKKQTEILYEHSTYMNANKTKSSILKIINTYIKIAYKYKIYKKLHSYKHLNGKGHSSAHLHIQRARTPISLERLSSHVLLRQAETCQAEDDSRI